MHEISIAQDIVDTAAEAAASARAERVVAVTLRVGALAGVDAGALHSSFAIAAQGTIIEGARLGIIDVPLVVWCAYCLVEVELDSVQRLRCPTCGTPCGEIRRGRELDIESLEIEP
jgi:hydrogenase nickel incorporation protein HypA/HybF